jgi:hypothetical protein
MKNYVPVNFKSFQHGVPFIFNLKNNHSNSGIMAIWFLSSNHMNVVRYTSLFSSLQNLESSLLFFHSNIMRSFQLDRRWIVLTLNIKMDYEDLKKKIQSFSQS